eukprot:TRINITY_DN338254_c0_g1_i1.p1 TRINITY_DN338254_c0_g1~~TRINITY_DN338254_c0_g1_i1.p1  ORF type:complete len:539 (+),score=99.39 TRINITY_DN338254_c0_g1_i1:107-1723(+)
MFSEIECSGCECENCPHKIKLEQQNGQILELKAHVSILKALLAEKSDELKSSMEEIGGLKVVIDKLKSDSNLKVVDSNVTREIVYEMIGDTKRELEQSFNIQIDDSKSGILRQLSHLGQMMQKKFNEQQNQFDQYIDSQSEQISKLEKLDHRLDEQHDDLKDLEESMEKQLNECNRNADSSIKLKIGPYSNKFSEIENTDAGHGALLHELIQNDVDDRIFSAYTSHMRPGAVTWRNPQSANVNALELAYALQHSRFIAYFETYCDSSIVESHSAAKSDFSDMNEILGSYSTELVKTAIVFPNVDAQAKLLHRALKDPNLGRTRLINLVDVMLKRMSPEVKNKQNEDDSMSVLQVVYWINNDDLIALVESYCDEDILEKYSHDKKRHQDHHSFLDALGKAACATAIDGKLYQQAIVEILESSSSDEKTYKTINNVDALDIILRNQKCDYPAVRLFNMSAPELNSRCRKHKYLPKGIRVRRGPHWNSSNNVDKNGPGTVTYSYCGSASVKWDYCEKPSSSLSFGRRESYRDPPQFNLRVI